MARQRREPALDEREVKVARDNNVVVVRATRHTWIALSGDGEELVRDQGGAPETSFGVARGTYVVRTDGKLQSVTVRAIDLPAMPGMGEIAALRMTSDAKDAHPVDGVSEIAADGASFATITVEKLDGDGMPLTRRTDNDEVFLRATAGLLQDAAGASIRSVKLKAGKATFQIVSEPVARLATIEALGQPPLERAQLQVEFV